MPSENNSSFKKIFLGTNYTYTEYIEYFQKTANAGQHFIQKKNKKMMKVRV